MPSDHTLLNEILKGASLWQSVVDYKLGIPSEWKYSRHGQVKINGRITSFLLLQVTIHLVKK